MVTMLVVRLSPRLLLIIAKCLAQWEPEEYRWYCNYCDRYISLREAAADGCIPP